MTAEKDRYKLSDTLAILWHVCCSKFDELTAMWTNHNSPTSHCECTPISRLPDEVSGGRSRLNAVASVFLMPHTSG